MSTHPSVFTFLFLGSRNELNYFKFTFFRLKVNYLCLYWLEFKDSDIFSSLQNLTPTGRQFFSSIAISKTFQNFVYLALPFLT